jgi:hypothetical protein
VAPQVLHFFSPQDIESGAFWTEEIRRRLRSASFAIVCVTAENHERPWINYEAGAIAERLDGKVCAGFPRAERDVDRAARLAR